jgi:hypothetical protein
MIKIVKAFSLAAVLGASPQFALSDDLTVPPEFRRAASPSLDTPAPSTPAVKTPPSKMQKQAKKPGSQKHTAETPNSAAADAKSPGFPPPPTNASTKPHNNEPLSFGLKWNADNQTPTSGPSTSGLINDYNKNINGQPVGTGAEVGVKYKF